MNGPVIYTVGTRRLTQVACRADGVWFKRERKDAWGKGAWGEWIRCESRPFDFGMYIDRRAGTAKLPEG